MTNILCSSAALLIILFSLKELNSLVSPLLLATFISVLFAPVVTFLHRKKIPRAVGASMLLLCFSIVISSLSGYVSANASQFIKDTPKILNSIQKLISSIETKVQDTLGMSVNILEHLNLSQAMKTSLSLAGDIGGLMSSAFLVLLISYFMLLEAPSWGAKLRQLAKSERLLKKIESSVKTYIGVKTITSLTTGVIIAVGLLLSGHKYWILWGALAFALNYIPSIGSIIAAVPPLIVSLTGLDDSSFLATLLLYVVVNVGIGSFLEPRLLGQKLGIPTLVILLSMLFWGQWFELTGMFLSVPITICLAMALKEQKEQKLLNN